MSIPSAPPGWKPRYTDPCRLPMDLSCCPDWSSLDPDVQARSAFMAQETLRVLTGYRVGNCPVTVRPCLRACQTSTTWVGAPVLGVFGPYISGGRWFNVMCGCPPQNCSCVALCEIALPGEVASVEEVLIDGTAVDPTAYRVDNGHLLVRTDGDCWPKCQHMERSLTEPETFGVTFTSGVPLDPWGQYALGLLACEFSKACTTGKCRLPGNVTQVIRQGVTYDFAQSPMPGGLVGIREVDMFVSRFNPNRLTSPSMVWSPDRRRLRTTTWPSP